MTKQKAIFETETNSYECALSQVLTSALDFIEASKNKRTGIWLMHSIMQSLARKVLAYQNIIEKASKVADDPASTPNQIRWWTEKLESMSEESATSRIYEDFASKYDKAVVDYTSDNLDNFDMQIPMSDEILSKTKTRTQQTTDTETAQLREGLKFYIKNG